MAKRGKPLRYETVEAFNAAIDDYFTKCEGEYVKDEKGAIMRDKNGMPIMQGVRPPTMTGLALHLGFTSRQAFLNYKYRKEYVDSYLRARARCEDYAESRLYDRDGARGAQFSLKYNFGWRDGPDESQAEKTEDSGLKKVLNAAAKAVAEQDDSGFLPVEDADDETG